MDKTTGISENPAAFREPRCRYCGAGISSHQMLRPGHCGQESCKLAHISHGIVRQKNQRADEYSKKQTYARAGGATAEAAEYLGCNVDQLLVAAVPFQDRSLIPLSDARKEAFIEHLNSIIAMATAASDDAGILVGYQHSSNSEPGIVEAGCAACQGHCCIKGGGTKFAFLTRQSIYFLLDKTTEWSPETLSSVYINAIPEFSIEGSCIFHGINGCTLGRDLRPAICNSFHCHDLYALHELTDGRTDLPVLIVGINESEVGNSFAGGHGQKFELVSTKSSKEIPFTDPDLQG